MSNYKVIMEAKDNIIDPNVELTALAIMHSQGRNFSSFEDLEQIASSFVAGYVIDPLKQMTDSDKMYTDLLQKLTFG